MGARTVCVLSVSIDKLRVNAVEDEDIVCQSFYVEATLKVIDRLDSFRMSVTER